LFDLVCISFTTKVSYFVPITHCSWPNNISVRRMRYFQKRCIISLAMDVLNFQLKYRKQIIESLNYCQGHETVMMLLQALAWGCLRAKSSCLFLKKKIKYIQKQDSEMRCRMKNKLSILVYCLKETMNNNRRWFEIKD
jgi:hypothetical protein